MFSLTAAMTQSMQRNSCIYIALFSPMYLCFTGTLWFNTSMSTVSEIKALVKIITTLSNGLPQSIPLGTKKDKIWMVMHTEERETAHETFNRRFDAMFGEDCRDTAGRLQHIRKGKLGLGSICAYLSKIDWADNFPLDIVEIKLQRLIAELQHHQYVLQVIFRLSCW
jgi:hypothetical protein